MILACMGKAQTVSTVMPEQLTIARHSFFDFGPPNDFYEVIQVASTGNGLSVERAMVTPPGMACVQPAKIELSSGTLHETMEGLLASRNPCTIPEKDLHREQKRCKKCNHFSGVNVTMQMNCGGKDRQIRMDILDRDLFGSAPGTPKNTSWTMAVLEKLDRVLGPGAMDKPMFPLGAPEPATPPRTGLTQQIIDGSFDSLFDEKVSLIAQDAAKGPPPPPTIVIESVGPVAPITADLPKYPPIARLARVEGLVEATFDIDEAGAVRNIQFSSEQKGRMLQTAVIEALGKWKFSPAAWGKGGKASIRFSLNCKVNPS